MTKWGTDMTINRRKREGALVTQDLPLLSFRCYGAVVGHSHPLYEETCQWEDLR